MAISRICRHRVTNRDTKTFQQRRRHSHTLLLEGSTTQRGVFVFKRTALVLALIAVSVAAVGCGGQIDEANAAIDAANAKVTEYNKLDGELTALMDEAGALGSEDADFKRGVELADEIIAKLAEQDATIEACKAEYDKIGALDVDDEVKQYAKMQTEAANKQLEASALFKALAEDMRELNSQVVSGKATEKSTNDLADAIDAKLQELDTLSAEIEELEKAASDYYDANLAV